MTAQIKLLGILKSYVGNQSQIEVNAGGTVREMLHALKIPSELVALVPDAVVTVTSTVPALPAGEVAVLEVALL